MPRGEDSEELARQKAAQEKARADREREVARRAAHKEQAASTPDVIVHGPRQE